MRSVAACTALVCALGAWLTPRAAAAPSELCPGLCDDSARPCGAPADCADGAACRFEDACLPGLARLVAAVVPEGPGGLNDPAHGWTCGLMSCRPDADTRTLAFRSDYGHAAVATKELALEPGRRYLVGAEMRADPRSWGWFDVVATGLAAPSEAVVASEWRRVWAFVEVPPGHVGPLQFRLHADGPGYVAIRAVVALELADYGVFLRLRALSPARDVRFDLSFILRHSTDGPGATPSPCTQATETPGRDCIDPAHLTLAAPADEPSPWLEVSALFGTDPAGSRFTTSWRLSAAADGAPIEGATVLVELATSPTGDDALVWSGTRTLTGDRFALVLPEGVPPPQALLSTPGFIADKVALDRALLTPADARPTRFDVGVALTPVDPFESPSSITLDGLELVAALGASRASFFSASPSQTEHAAADALSLSHRVVDLSPLVATLASAPRDLDLPALEAALGDALAAATWQRALGTAPGDDDAAPLVLLGPMRSGLPLAGPLYRARFQTWLAEAGVDPAALGLASLSEALPLEGVTRAHLPALRPDPTADPAAARRFAYAMRFWSEATAEIHALLTRLVRERFGALTVAANAGAPLLPPEEGLADAASGADHQALLARRAVSGLLAEAFLAERDDCHAWQLGAFADWLAGVTAPWREAAQARSEPFLLGAYLHAARGDSGAKLLELAARGLTWFEHHAYGPHDIVAGDIAHGGLAERSRPWLERVRAGNTLLARAEPHLHGARRAPARIVMLASQSDAVWTDQPALSQEELGWHIALTQAHHPIDFMLEDEIAQGLLDHPLIERAVLIVTRKHVSRRAWAAIERWVEGGGTLILGGDLATHDEHGALDQARAEWQLFAARPASAGTSDTIRWATARGPASFAYRGTWRELLSVAATPIAVSDTERVVALRIPRGAGRIYALGLAIGEHFRAPEAACDATRPAELGAYPSGFSSVMREVMSDLVAAAGAEPPVRAQSAAVALHRLTSAAGAPLVLAIPYSSQPVSLALTVPELVRCDVVRDALDDAPLPLTFGTLVTTIEAPTVFTWRAEDCRGPSVAEARPELVEPAPAARGDEGCGAAHRGASPWLWALALVVVHLTGRAARSPRA